MSPNRFPSLAFDPMSSLKACHCCGLIHRLPEVAAGNKACCTRCGSKIASQADARHAAVRTAAAALGALVLFFPAVCLPILKIERLGHQYESSILGGTLELLRHGDWFVGGVVLLFSVVFPLAKIMTMLELSWLSLMQRRHKAITYKFMEFAGKWSMLDVMLLAFMVMLVKLGNLVEFHFGPAVLAFVVCVAMSMLASIFFDPHVIWQTEEQEAAFSLGSDGTSQPC